MNTIAVKPMQTPYGYKEQHLMIDGVFLPYYVDSYAKASEGGYFKGSVSLLGLYPAWGKDLLHRGEIRFIWNLIDREEPVILPLLVCEDDLDLSCIVIVAFVRKDADIVYWDRIGFVSREEWKLIRLLFNLHDLRFRVPFYKILQLLCNAVCLGMMGHNRRHADDNGLVYVLLIHLRNRYVKFVPQFSHQAFDDHTLLFE